MLSGIKYYSLLESSGYGLTALANIEALLAAGVPVFWTPLVASEKTAYQPWRKVPDARQNVRDLLDECLDNESSKEALLASLEPLDEYSTVLMHVVPEYWPQLIEPNRFHVGYTVWETSRLPRHFPALIKQVDEVLVPARFNRSVLMESGVDIPVRVVPHILSPLPATEPEALAQLKKTLSLAENKFVFYTINEWSARKAIWSLLRAYLEEFTAGDPVALVIKSSARGPAHEMDAQTHDTIELVRKISQDYPAPAEIHIINDKIDKAYINALHELGDCFASTSHSEGWGMGSFEAAGHGNPVLITGWGGQLDYLGENQDALIDYRMVAVQDTLGVNSYQPDQMWAEADPNSTRCMLRDMYEHRESHRQRAQALARTLHRDYSPQNIAKKLINALIK